MSERPPLLIARSTQLMCIQVLGELMNVGGQLDANGEKAREIMLGDGFVESIANILDPNNHDPFAELVKSKIITRILTDEQTSL